MVLQKKDESCESKRRRKQANYFEIIWLYQLSWKCKLATVTSYKADVSSISPSSERMDGLWVVCGFSIRSDEGLTLETSAL